MQQPASFHIGKAVIYQPPTLYLTLHKALGDTKNIRSHSSQPNKTDLQIYKQCNVIPA